jgi:putative addiction module CopG family antidote
MALLSHLRILHCMLRRTALHVSVTPELANYVAVLVGTGRYISASEVVRAALRLLQDVESTQRPSSIDKKALESVQ